MTIFGYAIPLYVRADSAPEAEGRLRALTAELGELLDAHPGVEFADGYGALNCLHEELTNRTAQAREAVRRR